MYRRYLELAAVTALFVATAAQAQEMRARTRSGRVIISNGQRTDTMDIGEHRGRMGINLDLRPDPSRDSIGARVAGVTPGGPADRAGVQTGDIVTRFNGTQLGVTERSDEDENSRPAMRLINLASRLTPGDTVRLDLRRGTQNQSVSLVAAENDMDVMMGRMNVFGGPGGGMFEMGPLVRRGTERAFALMGAGGLSSIELVKINPGLGEYFGTNEGLLVVSVGEDTSLGLRNGDVILAVGGRRVSSPPQAMRILETYEVGENVQMDVMRQKRRVSVTGKLPGSRFHEWRVEPNSFEMMVPGFDRMLRRWEIEMPRMEREFHNLMPRHHLRTVIHTEET